MILSSNPAAERMRLHRRRRRLGQRPVRIVIDATVIDALVKSKYLEASGSGDPRAIARAVCDFIWDKLIIGLS